jgi:hypothetical protein
MLNSPRMEPSDERHCGRLVPFAHFLTGLVLAAACFAASFAFWPFIFVVAFPAFYAWNNLKRTLFWSQERLDAFLAGDFVKAGTAARRAIRTIESPTPVVVSRPVSASRPPQSSGQTGWKIATVLLGCALLVSLVSHLERSTPAASGETTVPVNFSSPPEPVLLPDGSYAPAEGYEWLNPEDAKDLRQKTKLRR